MTDQNIATRSTVPSTVSEQPIDYILLDGSGSMASRWWEVLDSIQAYIDTLKAQNVNSHVILSTFDTTDPDCVQRDLKLEDWRPLRQDPIGSHQGSTPLYDAINIAARRLRELNPAKAALTIYTDGEENASTFTSLVQAKAILDWVRAKGWQVTFVGCDFNNSAQARALGAVGAAAIGVRKERLMDATKALGQKRARYGLYGDPMHYTDEERENFGGYLSDHSNGNGA